MGYLFEFNTSSRNEIIEKFQRISAALGCDETYEFRFSTKSLDDAKALISKLDNSPEIDISVKGGSPFKENKDFTSFYEILKIEALRLVNLTITKRGDDSIDDFYTTATVIKRNKHRGVSIGGSAYLPKTKKSQTKFFDYYSEFFNSCFDLANLKTRASIEVSNGQNSDWKIGKKGVDIIKNSADEKAEIQYRNWYFSDGSHMLDFYCNNDESASEAMATLFDKIAKSKYFTNAEVDFVIWGNSINVLPVIEKNSLKFDSISNIVSLEIKTNKSLLDAMLQIPNFNGTIELLRPYSFQNSMSDSLGLCLSENKLTINLRAGMTSMNTIEKFKKMVAAKINEEVILKLTNLF